uniref:Aminopeptidase n=1 Tax=Bursaphelenchus xylophilus TaxID=6326 RepID=A0A1I7S1N1_BURXY
MRVLLLLLLATAVCCNNVYDQEMEWNSEEIWRKLQKDPTQAFFTSPFKRSRTNLKRRTNDRLPREVVVHSYDLRFEPFFDFDGFFYNRALRNTFNGEVSISFSVLKPTSRIELASAVWIRLVSLESESGLLKVVRVNSAPQNHLIIHSAVSLDVDKNYTLNLKYSGKISTGQNGGLFSYVYENPENRRTSLVATQFETVHARQAFPCFDDPSFKATFSISVIHPRAAQAYSNEEVEESRDYDNQRTLTRFKTTARMSSYLVAFAVGDFAKSKAVSKSGVEIRAIAIRNRKDFINNTVVHAARCVDEMEKLLEVGCPIKKLGLFSNNFLDPVEFSAGAMENFGLIMIEGGITEHLGRTISEEALQQRYLCHETAHQWFGDMVTADRWGLEFLHEAFAEFFEIETLSKIEEFRPLAEAAKIKAMKKAVETYVWAAHPVVADTSNFDDITYNAAGGFLRTIFHVLGGDVFYKALKIYLTENAFGNAGLGTLLQSFVKARGNDSICGPITFTAWANEHFLRAGVPTVHIDLIDGQFAINQSHPTGLQWAVPIFILDLNTHMEHILWLQNDGHLCSAENFTLDPERDYIFNSEAKGFAFYNISDILLLKSIENPEVYDLSVSNLQHLLQHLQKPLGPEGVGSLVYLFTRRNNGNVSFSLLQFLPKDHKLYKDAIQIISDNFSYKPTPENRLLGETFFEAAVNLNISSATQKARELFEEFVENCAPEKEIVECTKTPPEWRRAVYIQGAGGDTGRTFTAEYARRLERHPWRYYMTREIRRLQNL